MSHIDKAGPDPEKGLPVPRSKHGKHAKPETVTSHVVDVVEGKGINYAGWAFGVAILMVIFAAIHGVLSVFNDLCPEPAKGSCSRVPLGDLFGIFEIIFLILAVLSAIGAMLLAVEAITWKKRQPLAYTTLTLMILAIMFFVSGIYQIIIEKIVLRFIG
jgi:ABC-type Fe3+-siderophore transport system permease subunit